MPDDYFELPIRWTKTVDAEFPYAAVIDGQQWTIRINDFPEEPLYTLLVGGKEVISFDSWPKTWHREAHVK
jgi:hypothetical protein